jgi:hypothetical protein
MASWIRPRLVRSGHQGDDKAQQLRSSATMLDLRKKQTSPADDFTTFRHGIHFPFASASHLQHPVMKSGIPKALMTIRGTSSAWASETSATASSLEMCDMVSDSLHILAQLLMAG